MAGRCKLETNAHFSKGETLLRVSERTGRIGILKSGEAHVSFYDGEGRENIVGILMKEDSFGELFVALNQEHDYEVIADSDCDVIFINVAKAVSGCSNSCGHHQELLTSLVLLLAKRSRANALHIEVLSQRSLRDKLMTFLNFRQNMEPLGESFELSVSLGNLANYLAVDRSAMMREIRKMNDDGLIVSKGRRFRVCSATDDGEV